MLPLIHHCILNRQCLAYVYASHILCVPFTGDYCHDVIMRLRYEMLQGLTGCHDCCST